jgi:hypothetical protein
MSQCRGRVNTGARLARSLHVLETQRGDRVYLAAYFWIRLA